MRFVWDLKNCQNVTCQRKSKLSQHHQDWALKAKTLPLKKASFQILSVSSSCVPCRVTHVSVVWRRRVCRFVSLTWVLCDWQKVSYYCAGGIVALELSGLQLLKAFCPQDKRKLLFLGGNKSKALTLCQTKLRNKLFAFCMESQEIPWFISWDFLLFQTWQPQSRFFSMTISHTW